MREAPVHPRPPSRIWVLHPASNSLPPNGRLFLETPQAVKGTCLIPKVVFTPRRKGCQQENHKICGLLGQVSTST